MEVICSICGKPMEIDSPSGVAYIQESNRDIHHEICPDAIIQETEYRVE